MKYILLCILFLLFSVSGNCTNMPLTYSLIDGTLADRLEVSKNMVDAVLWFTDGTSDWTMKEITVNILSGTTLNIQESTCNILNVDFDYNGVPSVTTKNVTKGHYGIEFTKFCISPSGNSVSWNYSTGYPSVSKNVSTTVMEWGLHLNVPQQAYITSAKVYYDSSDGNSYIDIRQGTTSLLGGEQTLDAGTAVSKNFTVNDVINYSIDNPLYVIIRSEIDNLFTLDGFTYTYQTSSLEF